MSEEDDRLASFTGQEASGEISGDKTPEVEDFDQNGMLLKVAVHGITVQDY